MKDNNYDVVLNYINRAEDNLLAVMDEVKEFGDKGEQRFAEEALDLMKKVNRLYMKVSFHSRVTAAIAAQGEALTAP